MIKTRLDALLPLLPYRLPNLTALPLASYTFKFSQASRAAAVGRTSFTDGAEVVETEVRSAFWVFVREASYDCWTREGMVSVWGVFQDEQYARWVLLETTQQDEIK